jgi:ubiquinone/menaquinone biosynthesis C-methylase UbiE
MSAYDKNARTFDRYRPLPEGVSEAIRTVVLRSCNADLRPRVLDLGAGTGRVGLSFVRAGDNYTGADLSLEMLLEYRRRSCSEDSTTPNLVLADGEYLPFSDAIFDVIMLIQVIGGAGGWQALVTESKRLLRDGGILVIGQSLAPPEGVDNRMKKQLSALLQGLGVKPYHANSSRIDFWFECAAIFQERVIAAEWERNRTPREFLERQPTGARFSCLPPAVQGDALQRLSGWAAETFGSLDAVFSERYAFELRIFKFQGSGEVNE